MTRLADNLDKGLFGRIYPLVRTITEVGENGIKTYPGFNVSKGQYKHVFQDADGGFIYHRINGDIQSIRSDIIQTTSCNKNDIVKLEFPIRQVGFISRDTMQCSDIYADEQLLLWMIEKTMRADLSDNENSCEVELKSASMDSVRILSGEFSNYRDMVDINYEWAYVSVDYNFIIQTNLNCLCDVLY